MRPATAPCHSARATSNAPPRPQHPTGHPAPSGEGGTTMKFGMRCCEFGRRCGVVPMLENLGRRFPPARRSLVCSDFGERPRQERARGPCARPMKCRHRPGPWSLCMTLHNREALRNKGVRRGIGHMSLRCEASRTTRLPRRGPARLKELYSSTTTLQAARYTRPCKTQGKIVNPPRLPPSGRLPPPCDLPPPTPAPYQTNQRWIQPRISYSQMKVLPPSPYPLPRPRHHSQTVCQSRVDTLVMEMPAWLGASMTVVL